MWRPADILSWVAVTLAACAATVLLFVLFPPALLVAGIGLALIGIVNRRTRIGRLVIALGVVWFALGFTTSTILLVTHTKSGGGTPARAQTPIRHS